MMNSRTVPVSARGLPSGAVTFLLTDMEGSSRLWESDYLLAADAVERHREILNEVIATCGGVRPLEQGEGDSTVSAFNRPSDAIQAAHTAQRLLAGEPWKDGATVRVRMAINTGEALAHDDGTYAGGALNRCARLRSIAHGGQVLVSSTTRDLVVDQLYAGIELIDLGVHRLRDLSRPEHVWQLAGPGIERQYPPLRSLDTVANNLPVQLSSFVGREQDVSRGVVLLRGTRLLTLTGAGGCGKTRLAQRIAAEEIDHFQAGVWWVELASLRDGTVIGDLVGAALGEKIPADKPTVEVLAGLLGPAPALLMLDNCEHLIDATAAFVDRLLRLNPSVAVVATSREPLSVEGEVTWRIPSLGLPPCNDAHPKTLEQYDAVRLFIERALQARPNFKVTNDNAPSVAQICHRLDGIPLAIELAAARTSALSPERIAIELDDRFRLLIGHNRVGVPRQQTLYASVDWSHELLNAQERVLLRRLGAFVGGFTLDAAEVVVSSDPLSKLEVLDSLTHLVDKSLVQLDDSTGAPARYRLLETIRQYALDRLAEAGEVTAVKDRHLQWASDLTTSLEPAATNARPDALDQLDSEDGNLNAALDWAVTTGNLTTARRLVGSLGLFWAQRGHYSEAATWQSRVLQDSPSGDADVAKARWACSYVRFYAGDITGAFEDASAALAEARDAGDDSTTARCLHTLNTAAMSVDPVAARPGLGEAVELVPRQATFARIEISRSTGLSVWRLRQAM